MAYNAVETMIVFPLAVVYLLCTEAGSELLNALSARDFWLLSLAGPATALPLILFSRGMNGLSLSAMGLIQYICPTLSAVIGLCVLHESFNTPRMIAFVFTIASLVIYSISLIDKGRRASGSKQISDR